MRNDIKRKLQNELLKEITSESQVVYILSRIRKILELDNKKSEYRKLKFYCDWALHSVIDDTSSIKDDLFELPSGNLSPEFLFHEHFKKEFKIFLNEYNIETSIYKTRENENRFYALLTEIYSDTPIIIKTIEKKKITFGVGIAENNQRSITFTISNLKQQ